MNLKTGEVHICTEPGCRAEVVVRRGADTTCPGKFKVCCCSGKDMAREDTFEPAKLRRTVETSSATRR